MTAATRRWWWPIVLVLAWLSGAGCRRGGAIATAIEVAGTVERGRGDAWGAAAAGTEFVVGDTLRTGAASLARVTLTGGGVIRIGENARLRFRQGALAGQQTPDLAVELGSADVEMTTSDLSILTAIGTARVERGAHVRVHADGESARLEVLVGRAVMLDEGREVAVEAGHGVRIRIGSAEVQRFSLEVGAAVVEQAPGAERVADAGKAGADGGAATVAMPAASDAGAAVADATPPAGDASDGRRAGRDDEGRAEDRRAGRADSARADVTVTAGESATVHDGRSSIAVRLRLDRLCAGEAIVELGGGRRRERVTGTGAVVLRLKLGRRSYTVTCAADGGKGAPRASGALTLRRDTGFVPLARRAPVVVIDADGRRYTVLFQTQLPQLTLAWPSAPAGGGLALHVESGGGERVVTGANPRRPLPAGTVQEGTYVLWYGTPDGKQSPKTTVNIRFDNAAPTAQFFRTASAGTTSKAIAVDGVTVDGAKISVGGQPLSVDRNGRFRTETSPLDGDDAVAVRLEHPRTGIHYYVRRATGR
jgi:hypothetical protein